MPIRGPGRYRFVRALRHWAVRVSRTSLENIGRSILSDSEPGIVTLRSMYGSLQLRDPDRLLTFGASASHRAFWS